MAKGIAVAGGVDDMAVDEVAADVDWFAGSMPRSGSCKRARSLTADGSEVRICDPGGPAGGIITAVTVVSSTTIGANDAGVMNESLSGRCGIGVAAVLTVGWAAGVAVDSAVASPSARMAAARPEGSLSGGARTPSDSDGIAGDLLISALRNRFFSASGTL